MLKIDPWLIQRMNPIPYFPRWGKLNENKQKHILCEDGILIEKPLDYINHLEMSGQQISTIITYGVIKEKLKISRHLAFPNIRSKVIHTRNNMRMNIEKSLSVLDKGKEINWHVDKIVFNGILTFYLSYKKLNLKWSMMPSMTQRCLIESFSFSGDLKGYQIKPFNHHYRIKCLGRCKLVSRSYGMHTIEDLKDKVYYQYHGEDQVDLIALMGERRAFMDSLSQSLTLKSPDKELDYFFTLTKIRTCESIFKTKSGWMHSPGGGSYYGGMWTNDQCEYTNPLFAYMNYELGYKQSVNGFEMFSRYLDKGPLPSSIICEGDAVKGVAGDRGDTAMYAYGLGRFLLSSGDKDLCLDMISYLEKALSFCLNKRHASGVILSDSDELENRLPSGNTNLFTSSLVYDGLISMHYLKTSLGMTSDYLDLAEELASSIEDYFGIKVGDYESYRYCEENDELRSWAVVPLVMGIKKRSRDILKLVFSKFLHHDKGLKSALGHDIVWDRSLLYALRAAFMHDMDDAYDKLMDYVRSRMLGSHVPYPIEAYPEGNQKHLSGESALFIRVISEGILGYRPMGLNQAYFEPHLPKSWSYMTLKNFRLFGNIVDINVRRKDTYVLSLYKDGELIYEDQSESFQVSF
ncbi:hypothetical protein EZV73_17450 [Acidaminobacter sp. JC074]|uniref:hypothetical protein n=1 Tax=Acidaminobacter sp. JC074 TaxID=2530199 RepID=UPI001F0F5856|nr:hypothetical protein [Acidaminobacter sp. JC074]MCH4889388.1 hypothetical protein [Acidaminobacter sp. JC074]